MHIFKYLLRNRITYPSVDELKEQLKEWREHAYEGLTKDIYAYDNNGEKMDRRKLATSLTTVWDQNIRPDFGYTSLLVHEDISLFLSQEEKQPIPSINDAGYYHITFRGVPIFLDKDLELKKAGKEQRHTFQWVNVNLFAEPRRQCIIYNIGSDYA